MRRCQMQEYINVKQGFAFSDAFAIEHIYHVRLADLRLD